MTFLFLTMKQVNSAMILVSLVMRQIKSAIAFLFSAMRQVGSAIILVSLAMRQV
jgi:hypothetical protein